MAVKALLADGDRVLALAEVGDGRENKEILAVMMANARQNYIDVVRRSRPLIISHGEQGAFQEVLDRLSARIRFLDESFSPFGGPRTSLSIPNHQQGTGARSERISRRRSIDGKAGSRQNRLVYPVTKGGIDVDDSGISRLLLWVHD